VIERVRYEGLARCSRTFRRGDAALVVLSALGPGLVRGDSIEIAGTVGEGAHLIVTEQSATRVLGGPASSRLESAWTVERRATLELYPEPIIAHFGGAATIRTTIDCAPDATLIFRDIASITNEARLDLRTHVRVAGRDLLYDAIEFGSVITTAVGTFAVVGPAIDVAPFDTIMALSGLQGGIGVLPTGLFARVLGPSVWSVLELLNALRAALGRIESPAGRMSHAV
jgi:urease accessory protein UreH